MQNKSTQEDFYMQLRLLNLLNPEHARPGWDTYFIRLAEMAATRSNCIKVKQGVIIVNNKKVVATGYNGTPAHMLNCNENGCSMCNNDDESECLCIHAEINSLIEAGRVRTIGSDLYSTHFPCIKCARSILQSEIKRVIYSRAESFCENSFLLFCNGKIEVMLKSPAVGSNTLEMGIES